jgi:hypothetical protein
LGRALIERAFPQSGARFRSIISSPDIRAQSLYMKSGVYPRFPLYYLWRKPEKVNFKTDLDIGLISGGQNMLNLLADVDVNILDHRRDSDHQWLQTGCQGYLYLRDGRPVGYGYFGKRTGPVPPLFYNRVRLLSIWIRPGLNNHLHPAQGDMTNSLNVEC